MNVINPGFLFALAAAALPLLIHLLSRRRVPDMPFGSLRFLRRSDRRSMRRVSIRRLLLLAMRTAAIALIVLAFARPVVEGRLAAVMPSGTPRTVIVLLDASYSMGVLGSGGTAFDRAREAALDIVGALEPADEAVVVLFEEGRRRVYAAERAGREAAARALGDARPGWGGTDLRAALAHARAIARQSRRGASEIFIVSDLQRSGVRPAGGGGAGEAAGSGGPERVFLVPVEHDGGANVSVERVVVPRTAVHRGEPVAIRALLRAGRGEDAAVPVRVEVDGRRIIEREEVVPAGGEAAFEFRFEAQRSGWVRGVVSCRGDRLPADDERRFTVNVRERTRALLVASPGAAFYLAQALDPEGADGDMELRTIGWDEFQSADLAGTDVVVAAPAGADARRDAPLLRRFAGDGGRVVVVIAPGLEELAGAMSAHPLRISMRRRDEGFERLERPGEASALLAPFGREDLDGLARLRMRGSPAVSGVPAGETLLRFSDGTPFVWREATGDGEILFLAAEPSPAGGDLVLSPWFLPLVQQLALARLGPVPGTEGALVGSTIPLPPGLPEGCEVTMPDGSLYRPAPGGAGAAVAPAGDAPGFLSLSCGERWEVAVNPDCERESDLDCMTADEAADSLGLRDFAVAPAGRETARAVAEAREGREIAGVLAAAAILLLAAELALAQTGRPQAGEEGPGVGAGS